MVADAYSYSDRTRSRTRTGRGLAAAIRELCELALSRHGLTRLRATTTLDNTASRTVLSRTVLSRNGFIPAVACTLGGRPGLHSVREPAAPETPVDAEPTV